jgi:hypothetical protein
MVAAYWDAAVGVMHVVALGVMIPAEPRKDHSFVFLLSRLLPFGVNMTPPVFVGVVLLETEGV